MPGCKASDKPCNHLWHKVSQYGGVCLAVKYQTNLVTICDIRCPSIVVCLAVRPQTNLVTIYGVLQWAMLAKITSHNLTLNSNLTKCSLRRQHEREVYSWINTYRLFLFPPYTRIDGSFQHLVYFHLWFISKTKELKGFSATFVY